MAELYCSVQGYQCQAWVCLLHGCSTPKLDSGSVIVTLVMQPPADPLSIWGAAYHAIEGVMTPIIEIRA